MILCKHKQTEHSNKSANYWASLKNNLAGERNNKLAWQFLNKPQRKEVLKGQAPLYEQKKSP